MQEIIREIQKFVETAGKSREIQQKIARKRKIHAESIQRFTE